MIARIFGAVSAAVVFVAMAVVPTPTLARNVDWHVPGSNVTLLNQQLYDWRILGNSWGVG